MLKDIINRALTELNITNIPEEEKDDVIFQLSEHFNQVILDTIISSLNDEQLLEFKDIVSKDDPNDLDEEVALFVAKIPSVEFAIEEAINAEIAHIKASKAILDK